MTDQPDERPLEPSAEPPADRPGLQLFSGRSAAGAGPEGDDHVDPEAAEEPAAPPRARRRRGGLVSCAVVLVVVLALVVGGIVLVFAGMDRVRGLFQGPPDYSGAGTGSVLVQVKTGDSAAAIGSRLKSAGVVKSVDAFTQAAADNPKSRGIQVGFYQLRKRMSAKSALGVLVNPSNLVQSTVTVPEGARVRDIITLLAKKTHIPARQFENALRHPAQVPLHLPAYAHDDVEGYLYPATYAFPPHATAVQVLNAMLDRFNQAAQDADLTQRARALGYTPAQVVTVASILEYEANRAEDYPKVARVIYNRLDKGMPLQLDSTVAYVSGRQGDVWTTAAERGNDSLYNTYQHTGLPPGPIGSPGDATLRAALHPATGDWLYFVPDFEKGTTLFTDNYAQHLRNVQRAKEYCRTHDAC